MKAYFYVGVAAAAMLSATAVNAQVLGGNVAGGLGGTLSGGMRDMNAITQGSGNGSFGGGLETGSLHRKATGISGRATNTLRNTTDTARERTRSGLSRARANTESAASVATSVTADAAGNATAATRQVDATTNVAGSLASNATLAGSEVGSALDAGHQQQLASPAPAPDLVPQAAPNDTASAPGNAVDPAAVLEGAGGGSAQGGASASKDGASANASAETSSTAGASLRR